MGATKTSVRLLSFVLVMCFGEVQPLHAQQRLYSHGDPTAHEQFMLELINRARADPRQEAESLGINLNQGLPPETISINSNQPLAFHPMLIAAARKHSDWMLLGNVFSHTGLQGSSPTTRASWEGFSFGVGENIAQRGTSGTINRTTFTEESHKDLFRSEGHRVNMLHQNYSIIGIGLREGLFSGLNTWMTTQKFSSWGDATNTRSFLLGVVYEDKNSNFRYDPDEGIPNVEVRPSVGEYYAITSKSGGYAIPFDPEPAISIPTYRLPIRINGTPWSTIEPYDQNFRTQLIEEAQTPEFLVEFRSQSPRFSHVETVSMKRPELMKYQLVGIDDWFYEFSLVTGRNFKLDFEVKKEPLLPSDPSIIYEIDFSSPTHQVNQPPTLGQSVNQVSRIVFGSPTVRARFGAMMTQMLEFDALNGYEQIGLRLPPETPPGYRIEFDFMSQALMNSLHSFSILLDTPEVRTVDFHGGLNKVYIFQPRGGLQTVQTPFVDGKIYRVVIIVDFRGVPKWSVYVDSKLIYESAFNASKIEGIRFSLSNWYFGAPDSTQIKVALDNIKVRKENFSAHSPTPTPGPTPTPTPAPTPSFIASLFPPLRSTGLPAPNTQTDPRMTQLAMLEKQLMDARRIKNTSARANRMRVLNFQISSLKQQMTGDVGSSTDGELTALQKQLADARAIKNPRIRARKIAEINAKIRSL